MTKFEKYISAAVAGIMVCAGAATASAENSYHSTGDLILAFQNVGGGTGSDKVILVSLGNAAQLYRDSSGNITNIGNVGTLLTSTFGANWFDSGTVSMSALSAWRSDGPLNSSLSNGDPVNTVYISSGRGSLDGLGEAGTVGWSGMTTSSLSVASQRMLQIAADLENGGDAFALVLSTSGTVYDDNNPFLTGSQQGTAYSGFTGGTQYIFDSGSMGSWSGLDIEGALDLYRFQARNNIAGQYGYGEPNGAGHYLGSILLDQNGGISYAAAIPEPSTIVLLGAAGVVWAVRRRRQSVRAVL